MLYIISACIVYFCTLALLRSFFKSKGGTREEQIEKARKAGYMKFVFQAFLDPDPINIISIGQVMIYCVVIKQWWVFPAPFIVDFLASHFYWVTLVKQKK